jgi:hypothetical protein
MQTSAALTSSRLVSLSDCQLRAYGLLPNCLLLTGGRDGAATEPEAVDML